MGRVGSNRCTARSPPLAHTLIARTLLISPHLCFLLPAVQINLNDALIPDWTRIRDPFNPLYRVLVQMQEEIQSLRHELRGALSRLDSYDEARLNTARRLVGLPPARNYRSGVNTPPTSNPVSIVERAAATRE